jgi:hypothetical protein
MAMHEVAPAAMAEPSPAAPPVPRHPLALVAVVGAAAGLIAAAIRLADDFDHGIWLIAYLLLVGSLAPALLSAGERRVLAASSRGAGASRVALLWLAGVVAVPAGVLGQARIVVCAGALCLFAALALLTRRAFSRRRVPAPACPSFVVAGHALMIAVMGASTAIGVVLAWSYPWV